MLHCGKARTLDSSPANQSGGGPMKKIDFRTRLSTKEGMIGLLPTPRKEWEPYLDFYKMRPRIRIRTIEEDIAEMEANGIAIAVLVSPVPETNQVMYEVGKSYPGHFYCLAAIDPGRGIMNAYYELEKCYLEYGMAGFSIGSFTTGIPASDALFYPLYALSEKYGQFVSVHSSMHYNPYLPMEVCHPRHVDEIGSRFQGLNLVMCHAGSGFGLSPNAIAQRLPNVYMEYSALVARHQRPETLVAMNSFLKRKILFGSDYPALPYDVVKGWEEVIRPENQEFFFYRNAAKLLGLEG
jgi:predicted TIM-barrel fold metal-dependent hydrolase